MFKDSQEIFLVLFSILYGVMLQSLPGGLFPLGRLLKGYINIDKKQGHTKYWETEPNKIKMRRWGKRVLYSIGILNILPVCYFFIIFCLLNNSDILVLPNIVDIKDIWGQLFHVLDVLTNVLFIFWSALGVFGFYRIFYIIVINNFSIFTDLQDDLVDERGLSFDCCAHFLWACIYLLPGINYLFYKYYLKPNIILFGGIIIITLIFTYIKIRKYHQKNEINKRVSGTLIGISSFLISKFLLSFVIFFLQLIDI